MVTIYDEDSGCTFSVTAIAALTVVVQPYILVVVVISSGYGLPYCSYHLRLRLKAWRECY